MTGLFIRKGPVVQVRDPSGGVVNKADGDPKVAYDGPLVVLTSRWSASASEIVAGALQNYGRAIIVGDSSTHGKGTVQAVREMRSYPSRRLFAGTGAERGTGAIKLTIQKFYLPNGSSTQNKGVIPDISLPAIEDFREIGESDLPNALPYDEIAPLTFVGHEFDADFRDYLRGATENRLATLEEFEFLQKRVDWLKEREAIEEYSLNLEKRREVREAEEAWREDMKARQNELAEQLNYPERDVVLDAVAKEQAEFPELETSMNPTPGPGPGIAAAEDEEDDEDVAKFDIPLRESLRVLTDAIHVAVNSNWVERVPTIAATQPREEETLPR
jgi:carboxyl-terminal processing protease